MSKQNKQPVGYLIMYGLGEDSRPRAARFPAGDRVAVEKAANQLRFRLIEAKTEALLKLAKQLPAGKIFATGRSLVPYVRQPVYEQLVAAACPATKAAKTAASRKSQTGKPTGSADAPISVAALKTTTLIGLSSAERQKVLRVWPSKNRSVPDYCEQLVALWDVVWQSEISTQFADRARVFNFADFERCQLQYFAPTLSRCWQQRMCWGVHLVDAQWHLWTAIATTKDAQSLSLMFDVTDVDDARHPALTNANLDKLWRFVSSRMYEAYSTSQVSVPMKSAASSAEVAKLMQIAKDAIAAALTLLSAAAPAPTDQD